FVRQIPQTAAAHPQAHDTSLLLLQTIPPNILPPDGVAYPVLASDYPDCSLSGSWSPKRHGDFPPEMRPQLGAEDKEPPDGLLSGCGRDDNVRPQLGGGGGGLSPMAAATILPAPAAPSPVTAGLRRRHRAAALSSAFSPLSGTPLRTRRGASPVLRGRRRLSPCVAMAPPDLLGDLGGRDPFPAEIESNFAENVVANSNTEHKILIPNLSALSLAQRSCDPVHPSHPPMSREDAEKLLKKVVGWKLVEGEGAARIQCLWRLRDYGCGIELINRIYKAVESAGHYPNLHLEQPNQVRAELWTHSIGGLTMNDFIVAAKIDEIKTLDLLPKKRIWA
ncbi:hypothetical protein Taro_011941, partial [Colocasia esculenta]|nr:hypothetical protein [Colocasia esculenta]